MNFIHETLFSSVCLVSLLFIETMGFRPVSNPLATWVIYLEVQYKAYCSLLYSTKVWSVCVELYLCNPAWYQATLLATLHLPSILKHQTFSVMVRLFLCFPWNLVVHAGEWSASHPCSFAPGIDTPVPIQ